MSISKSSNVAAQAKEQSKSYFQRRPLGPNSASVVTKSTLLVLVLVGVAAARNPAKAQAANSSVVYRLNQASSFQQGCFPPCLCPVMIAEPVKGTFVLTPTGLDGFFRTYAVTEVNWMVPVDGTNMFVTGSGIYKIGGEFALQQELSLDLQLSVGNVKHFDSGLVADSAPFPDIKVTISVNGQVCFDTVFNASSVALPPMQVALASANAVTLSWPVSPAAFILKESSDLTTTNWTIVTNVPTVIGQQNQVVLARSPGIRFYRLEPTGN